MQKLAVGQNLKNKNKKRYNVLNLCTADIFKVDKIDEDVKTRSCSNKYNKTP